MKRTVFTIGLIVAAAATSAKAQSPYSGFTWVEPHHSSTAAEGFWRGLGAYQLGQAQFVQAYGNMVIAIEQARQQALANRATAVQMYYTAKDMYERSQATRMDKHRYVSPSETAELHKQLLPKRLTASQLDAGGRIEWPDLLTVDDFRPLCESIGKLFSKRAAGVPAADRWTLRNTIAQEVQQLHIELNKRIRDYPSGEYMAAKNFLDSLKYEAQNKTI